MATLLGGRDSLMFQAGRQMVAVVLGIQLVGAVLLSAWFWLAGDAPGQAVWRGVFTATSAFLQRS